MAGADPAPDDDHEDGAEADSPQLEDACPPELLVSFRDRSVTEIETSFSEHFVPCGEDGEDEDTPVISEDLSSSEFGLLPSLQHQDTSPRIQRFEDSCQGVVLFSWHLVYPRSCGHYEQRNSDSLFLLFVFYNC